MKILGGGPGLMDELWTSWPARRPAGRTSPSLIQQRPATFGVHHPEQAAKVTDLPDLRRTQARNLESVLAAMS